MGRGDRRTAKGKTFIQSHGKCRPAPSKVAAAKRKLAAGRKTAAKKK